MLTVRTLTLTLRRTCMGTETAAAYLILACMHGTGGLDRWTGPVDWTKNHFLLSNESSLVGLHLEHFPSQT